MSPLLVLVIITQSVIAQNTSVCVWGRDTKPFTIINREFVFQGIFNGAPWYTKQYGTNTLYLFNYNTKYCISPSEPTINVNFILYAMCTTSTSYAYECDQWRVSDNLGGWILDPDVFCEMGPCPEWNCDQIITDINYKGCNDTFSIKIDTNTYSNQKEDRFFYFNYLGFNWICNDEIIYTTSASPVGFAFAEGKWTDTSMGNSAEIYFTTPFAKIQEIQCLQHPTNEPTQQPTKAPTNIPSLSPSLYPTIAPTLSPSQYPSKVPTFTPTQVPTYAPTQIPTIDPTNVPSIYPSNSDTMKPTKNPLVIYVISSTLYSNSSNTFGPENNTTEGVNMILYIALIGVSMFVCGGVIGYCLLVICIPKIKAQIRNKQQMNTNHATDESPQSQIKVNTQNNSLIPAVNPQKMINIEMEVIHHHANELKQWLENIVHLPIYYDVFVESGYKTLKHIELIMNETHLMEIGIGVKTHRVQILKEIQQLRDDGVGYEGQIEPERCNTNHIIDGNAIIEQQIDDDFIIVGDDEVTKGNNATLQ